jgi:hypothetical protein
MQLPPFYPSTATGASEGRLVAGKREKTELKRDLKRQALL